MEESFLEEILETSSHSYQAYDEAGHHYPNHMTYETLYEPQTEAPWSQSDHYLHPIAQHEMSSQHEIYSSPHIEYSHHASYQDMMVQSINGYPGLVVCSASENVTHQSMTDYTKRSAEVQSSFGTSNSQVSLISHHDTLDPSKNTMTINEAFDRLREVVPSFPFEKERICKNDSFDPFFRTDYFLRLQDINPSC